jgi:hypothetical protein
MNDTHNELNTSMNYSATITEDYPQLIQKPDMVALWNSIDDIIPSAKINTDMLSSFDKLIIDNDITNVKVLLTSGHTIYHDDMLCSGYYQKKYKMHPNHCHEFICFKTGVYYALWLNNFIACRIFDILLDVIHAGSIFRFSHDAQYLQCKRSENISLISDKIKVVYDMFACIECTCGNKLKSFYDHNDFAFNIINTCYINTVENIISGLNEIFDQARNEFQFEIYDQGYFHRCHNARFGRVKFLTQYNISENNIGDIGDVDVQTQNVCKLKLLWRSYCTSCEVVKLLFNQQAYEYYKYFFAIRYTHIEKCIDEIITNPHVNINSVILCGNNNIFGYTSTTKDNATLTNKLIGLKCKLPLTITLSDVINKGFIKNAKEILKTCEVESFGNIDLLLTTILTVKMKATDKIEMIDTCVVRGLLNNVNGLIATILKHELSIGMLEKIATKSCLIKKTNMNDILIAIQLLKHKELDIMFENNPSTIDGFDSQTPLFMYLNEVPTDQGDGRLVLKCILDHKPSLACKNHELRTPLICSTKMNRIVCVDLLVKYSANVFDIDKYGFNSLHYAINDNMFDIVNILKDKCDEDNNKMLANELTHDGKHCLTLAMSCAFPVKMTDILLTVSNINYKHITDSGDNLLHYLIGLQIEDKDKTNMFKLYISKDIDLCTQSKHDGKPLVIRAVEMNLYEIVVMIMDKLLQLNEITVDGYELMGSSIVDMIRENKVKNIIAKNSHTINFYPLVLMYLKETKDVEHIKFNIKKPLSRNTFNTFTLILILAIINWMCTEYLDLYQM